MERIPALDGLRAVAIAMVVAYHVDDGVVPAGHWGVILFFVLSGYLVTRLLTREIAHRGHIDLRHFYVKRALRLMPALLAVGLALLFTGIAWPKVAAALGFYANYARIGGLDLDLLTHTWFVAVLAHFYLLWPLVIVTVPPKHRFRVVGALTMLALAWRLIAIGVLSPGWVYNATDTNALAVLAGAWLAVARPRRWRGAGWSIPALLALMFVPAFGDQGSALLWGGFVAVPLGVLALQHALSGPAWLEGRLVVWVGTTAYGIYLWHYVFVRSDIPLWIALALSLAAAIASRYLVEEPAQRWGRRLRKRPIDGGSSGAGRIEPARLGGRGRP